MNQLENYIVEVYSEKDFEHKELGQMVQVSLKTDCYGRENVTTEWFKPDEWKQVKEQGYFMA